MPASALVQLQDVKIHFGIKPKDQIEDALLNNLIPMVSAAIERYCNRTFKQQVYTDLLAGNALQWLPLRHTPAWAQTQTGVTVAGSPVITGLQDTTLFFPGMPVSSLNLSGLTTPTPPDLQFGSTVVTVDSSTQVTLNLAALTSNTQAGMVFGISVWQDDLASWGQALQAFSPATGLYFGFDYALPPDQPDNMTSERAMLFRLNTVWERPVLRSRGLLSSFLGILGNIKVQYVSGFRTIPYDVQLACLTAIARVRMGAEYGAAMRGFSYRGYGPQFTAGVEGGLISEDVRRLLGPYHLLTWGSTSSSIG